MRKPECLLLLVPLLVGGGSLHAGAPPVFYTVNSTADNPDALINGVCADGFGNCTLRAAVMEANLGPNASGDPITVNLPAGEYKLTRATAVPDDHSNGDLDVVVSLKVVGAGAAVTVIDANHVDRAFHVGTAGSLALSGVTIRNGLPSTLAGHQTWGGAILTFGPLTLDRCVIETSATFNPPGDTGEDGGGIHAQGPGPAISLTITNSTFRLNNSFKYGGAVNANNCNTVIVGSTFEHNTAGADGGGLAQSLGTLAVENSTFFANEAARDGGGIYVHGVGANNLHNVTLDGNGADWDLDGNGKGGGIATDGYTVFYDSFLSNVNDFSRENDDCSTTGIGSIASNGYNLIGTSISTCTYQGSWIVSGAPALGDLADNGGPTKTSVPGPGSPAIGAGNPSGCTDRNDAPLTKDQRGVKRPIGARCDLGAVEVEPIGDVNGDGVVDVADVFFLINHLFAGGPSPLGRANVNGDMSVSVADVFYLINYLFAGGPAPA
jgi:hypothetical protein